MEEVAKAPAKRVPSMGRRCAHACVALALGIAALGGGIIVGKSIDEHHAGGGIRRAVGAEVAPRVLARSILAGEAVEALALLGADGVDSGWPAGTGAAEGLPAGFTEELLCPADSGRVMADGAGTVGFTCPGSAEEVFDALRAELEGKGWTCTPLGLGFSGTFTKESGVFRWAFLHCYPVGAEVCVVLQCR